MYYCRLFISQRMQFYIIHVHELIELKFNRFRQMAA